MKVQFRTNLDVNEDWPDGDYDLLPPIGCLVDSTIHRDRNSGPIQLRVCQITLKNEWKYQDKLKLYYEIELHLPPTFKTISHWLIYYDYVCGRISNETYISRLSSYFNKEISEQIG